MKSPYLVLTEKDFLSIFMGDGRFEPLSTFKTSTVATATYLFSFLFFIDISRSEVVLDYVFLFSHGILFYTCDMLILEKSLHPEGAL